MNEKQLAGACPRFPFSKPARDILNPESHEIVTFTQRRNLPTFSLDWG